MTTEDRKEIISYLSGPREYREGVDLYSLHGSNLRLKRVFAVDQSETSREILLEELRKLAGLSEVEFRTLPRRAVSRKKKASADSSSANSVSVKISFSDDDVPDAKCKKAPEPVRKMIKFREQYPFLYTEDCPDILKVLVSDMFAAYYRYKEAHARLLDMPDEELEKSAEECKEIIENYLTNREIREELEYYKEHGEILGKASAFREEDTADDLSDLSEIDLMMQLRSAAANESKHRKSVKSAQAKGEKNEKAVAALEKWTLRKQALKEEVERRKKK